MNEVFNDRRVCDKCNKIFLMATETEDFIEGKSNPDINDEMVEGVYCFDCIDEMMSEPKEHYWEDKTKQFLQGIDYEDLITIIEVARIALEQESCIGNINLGHELNLSEEELERIYELIEIKEEVV